MAQLLPSGFQMWLPIERNGTEAQVRPNFYSQPVLADCIGRGGATRVVNVPVDGSDGLVSAYAAYDGGRLSRIRSVYLNFWSNLTPASPGPVPSQERPAQTVSISLPTTVAGVTAQHLTAPGGAYANRSLTWNGLEWRYPDGRDTRVLNHAQNLSVVDGRLTMQVNATEAVMLILN